MMRILALLAFSFVPVLGFAQAAKKAPENDWLIVPGKRMGPIVATTSRARLRTLLPGATLKDETVTEGEGEEEEKVQLTHIRGGGADATIYWADDKRTRVGRIILTNKDARWRTESGIRVGMPIAELQAANGKPFSYSGFGWEFGGMVQDWQGGKLQELEEDKALGITLAPAKAAMGETAKRFYGDAVNPRSDDAGAAVLQIEVESLSVGLR
jgi:hypothetical protein